MTARTLAFAVAAALAALAPAALSADGGEGWVDLFNGKDLDNWVQRGGKAKYRIEGKELVGSSVPKTPNSFLCTKRNYGDFILELEFKVHPDLNSGVQVRSQFAPEGETVQSAGKSIKGTAGGRVFGYQIEIDPKPRAWTGGVYDEGRRAWLKDLKDNEP